MTKRITKIQVVKINIMEEILRRKDWVKYLVLVNWHAEKIGELIEKLPDEAFSQFVENHVKSYLNGKQPPSDIQSAIMNITDDYLAGREVTMRAGDYIALQTHFRQAQS